MVLGRTKLIIERVGRHDLVLMSSGGHRATMNFEELAGLVRDKKLELWMKDADWATLVTERGDH